VTELADAVIDVTVRQGAPAALRAVSIVFDLVAVIGFALAGYFANKLSRTAFIIGIVVYAIDTVIVLLLGSWFMPPFTPSHCTNRHRICCMPRAESCDQGVPLPRLEPIAPLRPRRPLVRYSVLNKGPRLVLHVLLRVFGGGGFGEDGSPGCFCEFEGIVVDA